MKNRAPVNPYTLPVFLSGLTKGLLLIVIICACLFSFLAMLGFDPKDPGWSHTAYHPQVSNWLGTGGAWLADLMFSFLGITAWLVPIAIVVPALKYTVRTRFVLDSVSYIMLQLAGFMIITVALSALASTHLSNQALTLPFTSGGLLGRVVADWMISWFSLLGSSILLVAALLMGVTLYMDTTWDQLLERMGGGLLGLYRSIARAGAGAGELGQSLKRRPEQPKPDKMEQSERTEPVIPVLAPYQPDTKTEPTLSTATRAVPDIVQSPAPEQNTAPAKPLQDLPPVASIGPAGQPLEVESKKGLKIVPMSEAHKPLQNDDEQPAATTATLPVHRLPSLELLDPPELPTEQGYSEEQLEDMSRLLERKLKDFSVVAEVVEVNPGPVITRFEIQPAPGVKASKITNLAKDLARSLAVSSVRVVEVIPGKSVMGIEIPNTSRQTVRLSEVLNSKPYREASSRLTLGLGNDIAGNPVVANLAKMPHLLVAGTTGSGKSVGVNAMLLSLLFKATPEEVRLIMVDPKMLELSIYEGIPHLLTPVITDMNEAAGGLRWCVGEMERRYRLMAKMGVRNLAGFNDKIKAAAAAGEPLPDLLWIAEEHGEPEGTPAPALEPLPFIVVVIDEFADMMMMVGKKVEELIARIAQKARAAGIHLILATQRPSVDVITGLIKANVPTRIAFQVSSKIDSRTILDQSGAENLLGYGDMLYLPAGTSIPNRVHGAFVSDDEVHRIVEAWKAMGTPVYIENMLEEGSASAGGGAGGLFDDEQDALYDEAVAFVLESRKASTSSVQRKLKIGYNRAARMIDAMEAAGVVSEAGSNGQREVLAPPLAGD